MKGRATPPPKAASDSEAKKPRKGQEIPDPVTKRVSKKLAKVMYQHQDSTHFPSKICSRIGSRVEAYIKKRAANFEDYKRRVIVYLQMVEKTPNLYAEIGRNFENDSLEDWLAGEMPLNS